MAYAISTTLESIIDLKALWNRALNLNIPLRLEYYQEQATILNFNTR